MAAITRNREGEIVAIDGDASPLAAIDAAFRAGLWEPAEQCRPLAYDLAKGEAVFSITKTFRGFISKTGVRLARQDDGSISRKPISLAPIRSEIRKAPGDAAAGLESSPGKNLLRRK